MNEEQQKDPINWHTVYERRGSWGNVEGRLSIGWSRGPVFMREGWGWTIVSPWPWELFRKPKQNV